MYKIFVFIALLGFISCVNPNTENQTITIFAGSASQPPTDEVIKLFEKETGIKVDVTYGGAGQMLSQMKLAPKSDIYFPGTSDYMDLAKKDECVLPETEKIVAYVVPAINVQKGNPKNIKTLNDLLNPEIRVAIANPDGVCVGSYAVEVVENSFDSIQKTQFRNKLVNYTESCSKTVTAVSLKSVDAVICWGVVQYWDPERVETIKLDSAEIQRVGYMPIAISKFSKNTELAQKFIDFIISEKGMNIFKKNNYFISPNEAFDWIGEEKPVGGEYKIPEIWIKK